MFRTFSRWTLLAAAVVAVVGTSLAFPARSRATPRTHAHALRSARPFELGAAANCGSWVTGCTPPLHYLGGPVQHHPKVYFIFWGPLWSSNGTLESEAADMEDLFKHLAGSDYNDILTQYNDGSDYVHNDTQFAGMWTDPYAPPSTVALCCGYGSFLGEAQNALSHNSSWKTGTDSTFLVFPQTTTTVQENAHVCGAHDYQNNLVYGYVDTTGKYANCAGLSAIEGILTHEYAEAATDPEAGYSNAWRASDSAQNEVGDLCQGWGAQSYTPPGDGEGHYVTYLWDNWGNGCDLALNPVNYTAPEFYSDSSPSGPAVATFNNPTLTQGSRQYIAWQGGNNHLNVASTPDGGNWDAKVTLSDASYYSPSLAGYNNALYLAFTGTNGQLNVESTADGVHFQNKVVFAETSPAAPAIAAFGGALYLAYQGMNDDLNIMYSVNGTSFYGPYDTGQSSPYGIGPTLNGWGSYLFLAWTGRDANSSLNVAWSSDGIDWSNTNKTTLSQTSYNAPSLTHNLGELYLGWTGTNTSSNMNVLASTDGMHWNSANKQKLCDTSYDSVGLDSFQSVTTLAWTGTNSGQNLNEDGLDTMQRC